MQVGLTINDPDVLQEYHDILIPKAVEYSAGILDYFFRGNMSVNVVGYNTNTLQYTNLIVNTSGQDFYGGSFAIYQDDDSGVRTLIAQTNWSGALLNSNSTAMTFPGPVSPTNKFLLIYQGTIGLTSGTNSDPVDAGIAIAAKNFTVWSEQTKTYNYRPYLADIPLDPGGSITNLLESDDFPFVITSTNYEAIINSAPYFDDAGMIGSISPQILSSYENCNGQLNAITNTILPVGDISISSKSVSEKS